MNASIFYDLAAVNIRGGSAVAADVVIDGEEDEESDSSSDDDELFNIHHFRNVSQRTSNNGSGRGSTAGGRGSGGGRASTAGGRGGGDGGGGRASTAGGRGGGGGRASTAGGRGSGDGGGDAPRQSRRALGRFVDGHAIRSSAHAAGLIGLLQLASAEPGGMYAALGQNNRTIWIGSKIDALFRADGPLGSFVSVSTQVLMRHLKEAETAAKVFYRRHHSNDQSGASQEDIPEWAEKFFPLFNEAESQSSNNAQAAAARSEQRSVVASLVGRQAPLGVRNGPTQLRTETTRNRGSRVMRQQVIGSVDAEIVYEEGDEDEEAVEGRDDVAYPHVARRQRTTNGTRRRNTHLDFSPDGNDPSSRYSEVARAYSSITVMSRSIARSMDGPPRSFADVARDYSAVSTLLQNATEAHERSHYTMALQGLDFELSAMMPTRTVMANINDGGSAAA